MNSLLKKFRFISFIIVIMFAFLVTGCTNNETPDNPNNPENPENPVNPGGDEKEDPPVNPPVNPPVSHTLKFKETSYTIGIGEEVKLELETDLDEKDIVYKNTDASIASFAKSGNIKGNKAGTVIISASYENLETIVTITVTEEVKVFEKTDYRYWTNLLKGKYDVDAPLMTDDEIKKFNDAVYSDYSKSKVYDLTKLSLNVTGSFVTGLINNYSNINKYTVYKQSNNTTVSQSEKDALLLNRNMEAIPSNVTASYGIIVNFATMRSYPTVEYYSNDKSIDRFQETGLTVGEAVIIYHYSKDGEWCFVQAENYNGWIESSNVAKCTQEEFMKYYRNDKYMVVIAERIDVDGTILRLGDKVPYKEITNDGFVVYMPKKCNDETLCITETIIPNDEKVNDGYLTYNYTNLYAQGFKLLDTAYRWGDYMIDGRDCSSTQNAIYHCFGFVMPRNTSNQNKIPGYSTTVSGLNDTSMKKYAIGTLIFTSGHVMMYIGEDESGVCYLLHNSGYCKLQSLSSYGGSKMIATLTIR